MSFLSMMQTPAGRIGRIVVGVVIIVIGLVVVGGVGGVVLAIVGLIPLAAGVFNLCLIGPLLGQGLRSNR